MVLRWIISIIILFVVVVVQAYPLLLGIRRPSRNTQGFYTGHRAIAFKKPRYTLPLVELSYSLKRRQQVIAPFSFHPLKSSSGLLYEIRFLSTSLCDDEQQLREAVRRSVLCYGLFEVLASSHGYQDMAQKMDGLLFTDPALSSNLSNSTWRAGVVLVGGGELSLQQQQDRSGHFHAFFSKLDPKLQVRNENINPMQDFFLLIDAVEEDYPVSDTIYFCRRLAQGPAIGKGYTWSSTPRRPRAGILKSLAVHRNRHYLTPTAMEPEISLIMANLAGIERGKSRVLDPFCGSGSLLLAAGLLGAGEVVGTDAAQELMEEGKVKEEILASFGYPPLMSSSSSFSSNSSSNIDNNKIPMPSLALVDIADGHDPAFRSDYFDCIITDPPYSIKEKVRGGARQVVEGKKNNQEDQLLLMEEERKAALGAIVKLYQVADRVLRPGGRLVFFLPRWGPHDYTIPSLKKGKKGKHEEQDDEDDVLLRPWHPDDLKEEELETILPQPIPSSLSLLIALPQVFSFTFLRWLVVMEKKEGSE